MQNESIQITKAQPEDYTAIASIYNESISQGLWTMETSLKSADDIAGWVKKFNPRECLYIVKREEECIAWAIIKRYSDREGYQVACETSLFITQSETGKGYGRIIKKFLIEKCRQFGYNHIVAKIWASNTASIVLFEKMGYTIVGTQKNIGLVNGEWKDVTIMQYVFE